MNTKPNKAAEVITLWVVSAAPIGNGDVRWRSFRYTQSKSTLLAIEENDKEGPPMGLRRIPIKALPVLGGVFGLAVAARSQKEAQTFLMAEVAQRVIKAADELRLYRSILKTLKRRPDTSFPRLTGNSTCAD